MLELTMTKKGWASPDDNVRSRSKSRERVSLLGNRNKSRSSSNDQRQALRGRESRRRNGNHDEEKVSLLGMGTPGKRKKSSRYNSKYKPQEAWTFRRSLKYAVVVMILTFMTIRHFQKRQLRIDWDKQKEILEPKGTMRCFDESELFGSKPEITKGWGWGKKNAKPKEPTQEEIANCACTDPTLPLENPAPGWKSNHDRMVHVAENAPSNLDIVFFGDGMVEQLSGSRDLGATLLDQMEGYFDKTFTRKHGGKFNAIALGSSGDTGPNMLWHWENGIKQANLRPKLWFLFVGANDLYVNKCKDEFVVASFLNIAKRIFEHDENAKIVMHGILPRKDDLDSKSNQLGHLWNRAQEVNLEIRKFIKTHSSRIFYLNLGTTLFGKGGMKNGRSRSKLDGSLIDGIYPTQAGMKKWGDLTVKKLVPILKGFDMKAHRKQTKKPEAAGSDR